MHTSLMSWNCRLSPGFIKMQRSDGRIITGRIGLQYTIYWYIQTCTQRHATWSSRNQQALDNLWPNRGPLHAGKATQRHWHWLKPVHSLPIQLNIYRKRFFIPHGKEEGAERPCCFSKQAAVSKLARRMCQYEKVMQEKHTQLRCPKSRLVSGARSSLHNHAAFCEGCNFKDPLYHGGMK